MEGKEDREKTDKKLSRTYSSYKNIYAVIFPIFNSVFRRAGCRNYRTYRHGLNMPSPFNLIFKSLSTQSLPQLSIAV